MRVIMGGSEEVFQQVAQQLRDAGFRIGTPIATLAKPSFGLSDREMRRLDETSEAMLRLQKQLSPGETPRLRMRR